VGFYLLSFIVYQSTIVCYVELYLRAAFGVKNDEHNVFWQLAMLDVRWSNFPSPDFETYVGKYRCFWRQPNVNTGSTAAAVLCWGQGGTGPPNLAQAAKLILHNWTQ